MSLAHIHSTDIQTGDVTITNDAIYIFISSIHI